MKKPNTPHAALEHHVTGAIERGEAEAIVEQPAERRPHFPIGTRFTPRGRSTVYTVIDIYTTRNAAGELVRFEYFTEHAFAGLIVTERVPETTVARGLAG